MRLPCCSSFFALTAVCALIGTAASPLAAFQDEDFFPGLIGRYSVGEESVEKVDEVLSFDWGGAAPDERLPAGEFQAEWTGNLLVRLPGRHQFHAFVAGNVSVEIDGTPVFAASQQWGFASGEAFQLSAGDHTIRVTYKTPSESDKPRAKLAVFWSSDQFTLEPLPADVLYRDEPAAEVAAAEHGGRLFDSLRCAACHRDPSVDGQLPVLNAPALDRISPKDNRAILTARLWGHGTSRMPNFDLNLAEQESVVEYLLSVSKGPHKESETAFKDGDVDGGFKLLNSLGCVACHSIPVSPGNNAKLPDVNKVFDPYASAVYNGPPLLRVGDSRTASWLDRWLNDPSSLNSDHRMPVFTLSSTERRQLVAVLSQAKSGIAFNGNPVSKDDYSAAQGKQIIQAANCAACHSIPGIEATVVKPLTAAVFQNTPSGCMALPEDQAGEADKKPKSIARVPSFARILDPLTLGTRMDDRVTDRQAIAAWVKSGVSQSAVSAADRGHLLLQRNGCLACHDRNNQRGLSAIANELQKAHPDLAGQSQGLIPPSLTAVGDKLNDDYLAKAVAGEQKKARLPWLLVRMPKFAHSDADRAALVHHLKTTDRIPDEADAARSDILAHADLDTQNEASTEDLLLGNTLTGAGGFNCVACHKAGEFEPRNVALGTRGSDIMTMGDRIRPRFFQRWMKNPIRVVAGIEMPAIKKAMPDVLDASLPRQIGAIWKALSDKRFTPPTVTSRFEQVVNVLPNGPPRIIRDVFTIGTQKDRIAVPRALAVGFGNGHNLLLDLHDMQVRQWTMGEFARQRTEGKSWYWDMPGIHVKTAAGADDPFTLHIDDQVWKPLEDEGRLAELLSYRTLPDGVELTAAWHFVPSSATTRSVSVEPHFAKTVWEARATEIERVVTVHRLQQYQNSDGANGWQHTVELKMGPSKAVMKGYLSMFRSLPEYKSNAAGVELSRGGWGQSLISRDAPASVTSTAGQQIPTAKPPVQKTISSSTAAKVTSTPGFDGLRLPIDTSVMPTSMAWLPDGRLIFTSLKGNVWMAETPPQDSAEAGTPMSLTLFEEGLAAPFGILADGDAVIVAHKPEILRLRDTDGDGRADSREVIASGWGFNDNYHDWTGGIVRGTDGNIYAGLGSDYSQKNRPKNQDRWRGGIVKIDPSGIVTPMGMSMRYPMGLAIDKFGQLFATDNQGVQNTFNEINHIILGKHYGVPSTHQPTDGLTHESPAIMVPHPWTRSVNSILFLPDDFPEKALRGHGIGCEYDSRFLMRFTVQNVDGVLQGASYRFSLPNLDEQAGKSNFIGPICSAVSPQGEIFIGSIWDSGWQGGRNTGGISKLSISSEGLPNGIREVIATADGFVVEFFEPVNSNIAQASSWSIRGLTRKWGGGYATPDSGQYSLQPRHLALDEDGRRLTITVDNLKPEYLYSLTIDEALAKECALWPAEAHYSMKVVPQ